MCKSHDQRSIESISFYAIVIKCREHNTVRMRVCVCVSVSVRGKLLKKQHENINKYIECALRWLPLQFSHTRYKSSNRSSSSNTNKFPNIKFTDGFYWIFSIHTEFVQRHCSFSHTISKYSKQNAWLEVGCESPIQLGLIRACAKRLHWFWFFLDSFILWMRRQRHRHRFICSAHNIHKFAVRIPMMFVWCLIKIAFQKFRRFHAHGAHKCNSGNDSLLSRFLSFK